MSGLVSSAIMSPSTFGWTCRARSEVETSHVMNLLETLTMYLKSWLSDGYSQN